MTNLELRVRAVQQRIAAAAERAGRDPAGITLVAVSKTQPPAVIQAAYELGLRHFGENRVEEAAPKLAALPGDIVWHMIGHIQGRKAGAVASLFDMVHSLDSVKLAHRFDRLSEDQPVPLPVLLEFNVSGEAGKYGIAADRWSEDGSQREQIFAAVREIIGLSHLRLQGLMTMAPIVVDAEQARPVFTRLRQLLQELAASFPQAGLWHLSMGMTDDFEVAIEEGATLVRVGRAIFDPDLPPWRKG